MDQIKWFNDLNTYLFSYEQESLGIMESVINYHLTSYIEQRQSSSFSEKLLDFIDTKGFKDTEVYKRAGIDRKLFSKIRSNPTYQPKKKTAFLLCLSLELSLDEARSLLGCAGYSFSSSHTLDLIIQYCLEKKIYNIYEINYVLDHYKIEPF